MAEDNREGALDAYQKSLQIRTRLTETDPNNTQWRDDLVWVSNEIAQLKK